MNRLVLGKSVEFSASAVTGQQSARSDTYGDLKNKKIYDSNKQCQFVLSKSAEKQKNNWNNKGNGPQHWIPKIRTEDKYFPRKVTTSSNCYSKVFSTIFNSSRWIVLPLSFYGHFWTIFIFPFLL